MFALFVILTLIAAVLLIGVVLIQKSKGGGLSSTFAGSNQLMGVRRTNNFIEKATWILAGAIVVLAVACTYTAPNAISRVQSQSRVQAPVQAEQTTGGNFDTNLPAAAPQTAATPTDAETTVPAPAAPATETPVLPVENNAGETAAEQ